MEFIKKHKLGVIITTFGLLFLILVFFGIKGLFYSGSGRDVYGNRLEGIKDVPIASEHIETIKTSLLETKKVNTVTYYLKGKIMQFHVDVMADVDLNNGKSIADKIIETLDVDVKKFYDIQVFLTSKEVEGETLYPVIGYKHKTSLIFNWSNTKVGG